MSDVISRADMAEKYFKEGANCSQAVLAAYADELGISVEFAMRLASGFGGGVGRMREVCGAFSGVVLIENLRNGFTDHTDKEAKDACYARIQALQVLSKSSPEPIPSSAGNFFPAQVRLPEGLPSRAEKSTIKSVLAWN